MIKDIMKFAGFFGGGCLGLLILLALNLAFWGSIIWFAAWAIGKYI
jgi:hypothetical protein